MGYKVDYEAFIKKYMEVQRAGGNMNDVSKATNTNVSAARARVKTLAERGLTLPPLANGHERSPLELRQLRELLIQETAPKRGLKEPPIL